jgi:ribosomal protein RSM22 (predicted rRNA methylase)
VLDAWTDALASLVYPEGIEPQQTGHLARQVKNLWARFNSRRDSLDRAYMADENDLDAYLAAFALPNAVRTRAVLDRYARSELATTVAGRIPAGRALRVLDFGSGPLSATVGLLAALAEAKALPDAVEILAVETAADAVKEGAALLSEAFAAEKRPEPRFRRAPHLDALPQSETFDVVLAANVFNELPSPSRARVLARLAQACAPGGILLVLEPGQDVHSRALSGLRDRFLAAGPAGAFTLVAPCLHRDDCPLGPDRGRPDWCWFRHNWTPPAFLSALDAKSGLEHDELAYSFLIFRKSAPLTTQTRKAPHARVVSDPIPLPKTTEGTQKLRGHLARNAVENLSPERATGILADPSTRKVLLCTSEGRLEGLYSPHQEERKTRGAVVELARGQLRGREREQRQRRDEPRGDFEERAPVEGNSPEVSRGKGLRSQPTAKRSPAPARKKR